VAWNVPGGNGDKEKDPWSQRKKVGSGSGWDLDQVLRNLQKKLTGIFGRRRSGGPRFGIGLVVIVAGALWLLSGIYVVQQGERGVVLRFGALREVMQGGLHWHIPYPIETVEKVNVEKVSTLEIGYRSNLRVGGKSGGKSKVPREALMITGDENIIDIEFAVQYKIKDADAYLFNVRDQELTISQSTESAVREVVGRSTLDFALVEGRDQVERDARALLQQILDRYRTGIEIVTVQTQKAQPPDEVKPAFDDAVKAREDEQRLKNEAEAYANDIIPRARGAAARMLQEAEGHRASVISRAEGDARRFGQIVTEYAKAPAVTRERLYIEAMEQILSSTTKIYIDQKSGNNVLYLPLDKLLSRGDGSGTSGAAAAPEAESASPAREPAGRGRGESRRRGQP
jgi:membrane protease subunit HflK